MVGGAGANKVREAFSVASCRLRIRGKLPAANQGQAADCESGQTADCKNFYRWIWLTIFDFMIKQKRP
jgi:hypothetical protein